jgi:hypothetical protein
MTLKNSSKNYIFLVCLVLEMAGDLTKEDAGGLIKYH